MHFLLYNFKFDFFIFLQSIKPPAISIKRTVNLNGWHTKKPETEFYGNKKLKAIIFHHPCEIKLPTLQTQRKIKDDNKMKPSKYFK